MCLLLVAHKSHARYPLIIAANRDELHARPALEAHFWDDEPSLMAGRDLEAGGTWLGLTKNGRFAAVTNYHERCIENRMFHSRGSLVTDFLLGEASPREYADDILQNGHRYQGFNLVFGALGDLYYCSNRRGGSDPLRPGIYGLSNHLLNDDSHKVKKGTEALMELLSRSERIATNDLFSLLSDREGAPDEGLSQGVSDLKGEHLYSPVFIVGSKYGTRCSTGILVSKEGKVIFSERSFSWDGKATGTVQYEFRMRLS